MKNMKLDTKKLGIVIAVATILIVIIAIAISGGNKDIADANTQNNNNESDIIEGEKLAEVKEYKGLEISNVKFTIGEKTTRLTADVVNNTGTDKEGQLVNINVLDENGNLITSTMGWINDVKAGGVTGIGANFMSTGKENGAYNIEITEKRAEEPVNNGNLTNTTNS